MTISEWLLTIDFYISCELDGNKQKTRKTNTPAVPSIDMLGGSTISAEDANEFDTEYRWNEDLIFLVASLKTGHLSVKLKSQAMVTSSSQGEVVIPLSHLERPTANPIATPKRRTRRTSSQIGPITNTPAEATAPEATQLASVLLFKGWLKAEDKSAMFFVFMSFAPYGLMNLAALPKKDGIVRFSAENHPKCANEPNSPSAGAERKCSCRASKVDDIS